MDFSKYSGPSPEWLDYASSHADLRISDEGKDDAGEFGTAIELRDAINAARGAGAESQVAVSKLGPETVHRTDYDVRVRDGNVIVVRVYKLAAVQGASMPAYLYFHGGGMLVGSLEGEDFNCALWTSMMRGACCVVHVCYRHVPEWTYPTQMEDAWDAFEWLVGTGQAAVGVDVDRIVLGGVSAGGCLAASVVAREVDRAAKEGRQVRVRGQLLAMPWLVHRDAYPWGLFASREKTSLVQCADAPILPRSRYDLFTHLFSVADPTGEGGKMMNTGLRSVEEMRGMPRTVLLACGWDMLRDEAMGVLAPRLEEAGVRVRKHVFPGLPHGFAKWKGMKSSGRWDEVTVDGIEWLLGAWEAGEGTERGEWIVEVPESYRMRCREYFE